VSYTEKGFRLVEWGLIAAFVLFIITPSAGILLDEDDGQALREMRTAFPSRPHSWSEVLEAASKFKTWYRDHFALRADLVRWHGLLAYHAFHTSSDKRVMPGRDGWLFYVENVHDPLSASRPIDERQIALWVEYLDYWKVRLEAQGIRFLCFFGPDKQTIYPEKLPAWVPRESTSPAQQIAARLKDRGVAVADAVSPLLQQKGNRYPLYYKTDTHWNFYGALFGWRSVVEELAHWHPSVSVPDPMSFAVEPQPRPGGDMAGFMGLSTDLADMDLDVNVPQRSFRIGPMLETSRVELKTYEVTPVSWQIIADQAHPFVTESDDAPIQRAVIFRDSFFTVIAPWAGGVFSHAFYTWNNQVDGALIEREKPDVVIFETVERRLRNTPPAIEQWPTPSAALGSSIRKDSQSSGIP
jgi:hypothetical protein